MNTSLPPGTSADVWPDESEREQDDDFPQLEFPDEDPSLGPDLLGDAEDERPSVQQAIEDSRELEDFNPGHLDKPTPLPESDSEDDDDAWGTPSAQDWDDEDTDESWLDVVEEEPYEAEEEYEAEAGLPVGLLVAAAVAVLLLGVGGYGVIQDRGQMQQQITDLQAAAADAVSPQQAQQLRQDLATANEELAQLRESLAAAEAEGGALRASLTDMEQRLAQQAQAAQAAAEQARVAAAAKPAAPAEPAAASTPASSGPASAMTGDDAGWFVNFSSYSQRAIADSWAARLKPSAGTVTISTVNNNGRTIYRLRVVGLQSRQEAAGVARQLEQAHGVDSLWIGNK